MRASLTLAALGFVASLAVAAPAPAQRRQAPNYPPFSQSNAFTLVVNVTKQTIEPNLQNYHVSSYHIGAGSAFAVAYPPTVDGRVMFLNGTAEEVRYGESSIATSGGTPPVPYGLVEDSTGGLFINVGLGTTGLGLAQFPDPIPEANTDGHEFYACPATPALLQGALRLYTKTAFDETPAGCQDVTLLVQCASGLPDEPWTAFANTVNCYPDAASIDWSHVFP